MKHNMQLVAPGLYVSNIAASPSSEDTLADSRTGGESSSFPDRRTIAPLMRTSALGAAVLGAVGALLQSLVAGPGGAALGGAVGAAVGAIVGMQWAYRVASNRTLGLSQELTQVHLGSPKVSPERSPFPEVFAGMGQRITWGRTQQGWSLLELAAHCGLSERFLELLEVDGAVPSLVHLERIAAALVLTPGFLLGKVQAPATENGADDWIDGNAWVIGRRFGRYLDSLSSTQRDDLKSALVEQRFTLVIHFLCEEFPDIYTPLALAYQLGIHGETLERMSTGEDFISEYVLRGLTRITGIPVHFFSSGECRENQEPEPVSTAQALEYLGAISMALKLNMPAQQLSSLIEQNSGYCGPS